MNKHIVQKSASRRRGENQALAALSPAAPGAAYACATWFPGWAILQVPIESLLCLSKACCKDDGTGLASKELAVSRSDVINATEQSARLPESTALWHARGVLPAGRERSIWAPTLRSM